jgi:hypothetical protein
MTDENDILLDDSMNEINNILKNANDWQDALEKIAEDYGYLGDKKIIRLVTKYFFKDKKHHSLEERHAG